MKTIIALCTILAAPLQAQTCEPPAFGPRFQETIADSPDQTLFTESVLLTVNFERCLVEKLPLRTRAPIRKAAEIHSRNMMKTNTFNHISRAGNARTVEDRATLANMRWRWLAENIALIPRYQFADKVAFQVVDRSKCRFADPKTGTTIPPHSYASLAQTVTAQWMASDSHRKNILSRYAARMGAALEFDPSGAPCGQFYVTQVFAD